MSRLEDLPHRLWPKELLPPGVAPRDPFLNLKAAEFKKVFTKVVNPRLKAAGFKCAGFVGQRATSSLDEGTWLLCNGRGAAEMIIAAHPIGFPHRRHFEARSELEYTGAIFLKSLDLCPGAKTSYGTGHVVLDIGRNPDEAKETADVFAALFEAQGLPYLAELTTALEQLLAIAPERFDDDFDPVSKRLHLYLGTSRHHVDRYEQLVLLARLNAFARRPERTRAFCELGISELRHQEATRPEWRGFSLELESHLQRLARGEGPLHVTAEDRKAREAYRTP